jgi:hypothetical protein
MPRIVTTRFFRLWLAATLNDSDRLGQPRLGLSEYHARQRAWRHA